MGTHTHTQECCKCAPGLARRPGTSRPNQFRGVAAVSHQANALSTARFQEGETGHFSG